MERVYKILEVKIKLRDKIIPYQEKELENNLEQSYLFRQTNFVGNIKRILVEAEKLHKKILRTENLFLSSFAIVRGGAEVELSLKSQFKYELEKIFGFYLNTDDIKDYLEL